MGYYLIYLVIIYGFTYMLGYFTVIDYFVKTIENESEKKKFKKIGTIILMISSFIITIGNFSLINLIIYIFILGIICGIYVKKHNLNIIGNPNLKPITTETKKVEYIACPKCGRENIKGHTVCNNCGSDLNEKIETTKTETYVNSSDYGDIQNLTLEKYIDSFLDKKLTETNIDMKNNLIPSEALKKLNILQSIFACLLFFYVSIIFFHFPDVTYLIGFIILVVLFILSLRFNFKKYLVKQIKSRPSEKISNIIMNTKTSLVTNTSKRFLLVSSLIAVALPLFIFRNPRIFYEKLDDGYAVRFYAFGLTNMKTATIPETHNGKKIISLRGNTFSNMKSLTKINLPDSIIEIRGQAFKGLKNLESITLPENLEYLGGGAFQDCISLKSIEIPSKIKEIHGDTFNGDYSLEIVTLNKGIERIGGSAFENCDSLETITMPSTLKEIGGSAFKYSSSLRKVNLNDGLETIDGAAFSDCTSLEEIIIPDTVTSIGGESFMNNTNLSNVILSNNITEIRGNTFEGCTSLKTIMIPDSVTRIGGHAFYGSNLESVIFTPNSNLAEIGSSAFRKCYSLYEITIPRNTSVNERAFKESPTTINYFND